MHDTSRRLRYDDAIITVQLPETKNTLPHKIVFTPDGLSASGNWHRWGSFSSNIWFTAHTGRTHAITLANAVKRLTGVIDLPSGTTITWELVGVYTKSKVVA